MHTTRTSAGNACSTCTRGTSVECEIFGVYIVMCVCRARRRILSAGNRRAAIFAHVHTVCGRIRQIPISLTGRSALGEYRARARATRLRNNEHKSRQPYTDFNCGTRSLNCCYYFFFFSRRNILSIVGTLAVMIPFSVYRAHAITMRVL